MVFDGFCSDMICPCSACSLVIPGSTSTLVQGWWCLNLKGLRKKGTPTPIHLAPLGRCGEIKRAASMSWCRSLLQARFPVLFVTLGLRIARNLIGTFGNCHAVVGSFLEPFLFGCASGYGGYPAACGKVRKPCWDWDF